MFVTDSIIIHCGESSFMLIDCFIQDYVLFIDRYSLQYQEPIPCEQLVSTLCDLKQAYTQFGGQFEFYNY